ncbi:MAG: bifunctional riboflavin kinase/FAD synthetase [Bacilli bacterium]|nr:bifunctional riboflavin kinase/FAD synthetase [Bacilli bacterium]
MEIIHIRNEQLLNLNDEYAVAIGNFDGIHIAHEKIINTAKKIAHAKKLKFGVMCFDIPPRQLVNNIDNYYLLRSFDQKRNILEDMNVEVLFLLHFNNEIRNMDAKTFVRKMIIANNIKEVVCGYDFHFGINKSGDVNLLSSYHEFSTIIVPRYDLNNQRISSTLIHELIMHGEIKQANSLLTRPFSIIGHVIHGNKKGKSIGFPTANIKPIVNYRIPQSGVYISKTIVNNKEYYSMTNIGHNPTFNFVNFKSIETHIFDFNEDIYNQEIEIVFIDYLRRERIFDSIDDLIKQLKDDKEKIIEYFKEND